MSLVWFVLFVLMNCARRRSVNGGDPSSYSGPTSADEVCGKVEGTGMLDHGCDGRSSSFD